MKHEWEDVRYGSPAQAFQGGPQRMCKNCGKTQKWCQDHLWMRVVRSHWYPKVGRCGRPVRQWMTTSPNLRSPATGHDAGQRGWKLHLVETGEDPKYSFLKGLRAACGLLPTHGWGLDLFIEDKCAKCLSAMKLLPKISSSEPFTSPQDGRMLLSSTQNRTTRGRRGKRRR